MIFQLFHLYLIQFQCDIPKLTEITDAKHYSAIKCKSKIRKGRIKKNWLNMGERSTVASIGYRG